MLGDFLFSSIHVEVESILVLYVLQHIHKIQSIVRFVSMVFMLWYPSQKYRISKIPLIRLGILLIHTHTHSNLLAKIQHSWNIYHMFMLDFVRVYEFVLSYACMQTFILLDENSQPFWKWFFFSLSFFCVFPFSFLFLLSPVSSRLWSLFLPNLPKRKCFRLNDFPFSTFHYLHTQVTNEHFFF